MTDIQLYTKLSALPLELKSEVSDLIDFLMEEKLKKQDKIKRGFRAKRSD